MGQVTPNRAKAEFDHALWAYSRLAWVVRNETDCTQVKIVVFTAEWNELVDLAIEAGLTTRNKGLDRRALIPLVLFAIEEHPKYMGAALATPLQPKDT